MSDSFNFHKNVIENLEQFSRSFITIRAKDINNTVNTEYMQINGTDRQQF